MNRKEFRQIIKDSLKPKLWKFILVFILLSLSLLYTRKIGFDVVHRGFPYPMYEQGCSFIGMCRLIDRIYFISILVNAFIYYIAICFINYFVIRAKKMINKREVK